MVNGDAELVIVCENRQQGDRSGGFVGHQGAIDVEDVRSAVTQVMEGGEEAFKLRKEKYGFSTQAPGGAIGFQYSGASGSFH
ncbi:MAG: hypothetical protein IPH38_17845 [Candidatus Microthrix sp.]|nr:hypothetical protein [Candidatus Microthrix sp.]MBK7021396.1 hypothetical protein [Candidatus Microthrix sp.]